MHPGRQHVVGVAGPGHGAAADRPAMLLEGHDVGHHLARVRALGQPVDHRHRGVVGELDHVVVVERADHDGVDIARQHARGVGDGLAAAELHLLAGQHDRFAAELAHGDIERHARARRRLVEDHRERLAGERLGRRAGALAPRLHGAAGRRSCPRSSLDGMSIRSTKCRMPLAFTPPLPCRARPAACARCACRRGRAAQSPPRLRPR